MERDDLDAVIDDITYLAEHQDASKIRTVVVAAQPADLAAILGSLRAELRTYVFELLTADQASEVLPELDDFTRDALLTELEARRLSEIVDEMASDEAAEIVAELPEDVAESVLRTIDAEDSAEVRELLEHEEETAGRIMQLELVSVAENSTVDEAIQAVRHQAEEVQNLYNVYAVDAEGRLSGVLSLKRLVLSRPTTVVGDIMNREVISVHERVDQEDVAHMFRRYDLVAIPVVDDQNRLIGRVTVDDALEILEEEVTEDIHRMAGLDPEEEHRETSALRASRARLPWLVLGMLGGIAAALVLARHESSLDRMLGLAFFVPIVMAMGGNSGFQASTIVIRGLAIGEISARDIGTRLLRELRVGILNGLFCSLLLSPVLWLWRGPIEAAIICSSLLAVIVVAAGIGAVVPVVLHRFRIDPGLATGPFITTSNDIIALAIYLTIAVQITAR
jgi:magnesium transporter